MDGRLGQTWSDFSFVLPSAIRARACVRGIQYTTATVAVGRSVGRTVGRPSGQGRAGRVRFRYYSSEPARPPACLYVCLLDGSQSVSPVCELEECWMRCDAPELHSCRPTQCMPILQCVPDKWRRILMASEIHIVRIRDRTFDITIHPSMIP